MSLDITSLELAARDARGLAMDAVAKCKSGHLGLPLGATEIGATIDGAAVTTALPAVTVVPGPPAVTTSRVVVAGVDSVVVGDTTTVELLVFDAFDNAVSDPGLAVAFAVAPAAVGSVGAAVYRSGNRYAAVFTGVAPGTALVGASIGGTAVLTAPAVVRVR